MTTVSSSEFFAGKPPAATSTAPAKAVKKVGIGGKIIQGAEKVTHTLGLDKAVDTISSNLATLADPRAAVEGRINQPSLIDNMKAGVDLGLTVPAPEVGGSVLGIGRNAAKTVAQGAGRVVGKGIEATGQKIQQSVIRPSIKDISDGFKIENVAKYDVGGSLPETIAKTHAKMNELGQQLAAKLKDTPSTVSLDDTLAETARRLGADKAASFGDNAAVDRILEQISDEVKRVGGGDLDLVTATNVKRGAGNKGAWAYNRPETDASAIERAYTEFYTVLKEQIEKAAPPGVKEINKQLSELISIQNAALRRLPVEQRNNVFSLTDSIGFMSALFDPKALLLVGASKAARSGKVGNALVNAGKKLQGK